VAVLALLGLVLPLLALCLRPLATDDTWWHLAMGALYAGGNLWPAEDPLLHTTVLRPPVPHEWLFQVALHGLHVVAGFQGLRVLHGALAAGILTGAFRLFRRAGGDAASAALATAVFACLSWFRLIQLRPDLVTVAAALALYALVLVPERPGLRRSLAALALLLVWCNAHSLFLIGLALLAAGAAGALFESLCARAAGLREPARASLRRAGTLAALCAAGALVTLVNPRGIGQHLTFATESAVGSIWKIRDDFRPWNPFAPIHDLTAFTPFSWALADLLFGAALLAAAWQLLRFARRRDLASLARLDGVHLALAAAALVACLVAVRFHWLAFLPLLYLLRRWRERERPLAAARLGFAAATALLAFVMPRANGFPSLFAEVAREPESWRGGAMDERYCGPGMRFLADAGLEGRLYQPFNEGGYLGYYLAPRLRTFIDGRLDHVPAEVLDDYLAIRRASRDGPSARLRDRLDRWGVDVFFADTFPESQYPDRASGFQLRRLPEWQPIYASRNCTVYLRRSPANRENFARVADYYRERGVPFDPKRGFDPARALREAPAWARAQRIEIAGAACLEAQRRGADPALRKLALAELAGHAWRIGDPASALALDEEWLAEEPGAFAPAWQRVDALLSLGRPHAALDAARALAAAHPDRIESERWLARAERAAARAGPASP
jgi:hypothetical protein